MLYNAWVLLGMFSRADHPEQAPDDRPVMPARSFAEAFYSFDPGQARRERRVLPFS